MPRSDGTGPPRLRVAIDARLAASAPEISWVLAAFLDAAGYARFVCRHRPGAAPGENLDPYCGLEPAAVSARSRIQATGHAFPAAETPPTGFAHDGTTPIPGFTGAEAHAPAREDGVLHQPPPWCSGPTDGSRVPGRAPGPRDRFDNLDPAGTPIGEAGLLGTASTRASKEVRRSEGL